MFCSMCVEKRILFVSMYCNNEIRALRDRREREREKAKFYMCNGLCLKISNHLFSALQIMHLFVALILTNDDSSVLSSTSNNNVPNSVSESHAKQSTIKSSSSSNGKFNLHIFLKEKLLEPNIQKIYGKLSCSETVVNGMFISALALYAAFFPFGRRVRPTHTHTHTHIYIHIHNEYSINFEFHLH